MGLITRTQEAYYNQSQTFTGNGVITGSSGEFVLTVGNFPTLPTLQSQIKVFIDGREINKNAYTYNGTTVGDTTPSSPADYRVIFLNTAAYIDAVVQETSGAPKDGLKVRVQEAANVERFGGYRYVSLKELVNNYIIAYVGDNKLIENIKRSDVLFHVKRGIAEFSYDIGRVEKIQEIEIGPSLSMPMPQDYINYVRISWVDTGGVEHIIYPAIYTSRPSQSILQASDYSYIYDADGSVLTGTPTTSSRFDSLDVNQLSGNISSDDYFYNQSYMTGHIQSLGARFGVDPQHAQSNGVFVIDEVNGKISFSSDINGKTITLKYISDGLGTDNEMKIHKLAEEAMYNYVSYAILSSRINVPEYIINRLRKSRRASMRNAKLRLSNLKFDEITQTMRGKSKHIKH
jgi:hypothetical protein